MTVPEQKYSWSRFYSHRKKIRSAYSSIYDITIRKKLLDIVLDEVSERDKILDVGASSRVLGERLLRKAPSVTYKTMDIDREQEHDYHSIDDIGEHFNLVVLAEVIEHLGFQEGISMLERLFEILLGGGKLIVSTPNVHHPNSYWWDHDHKVPYRYDEMGAALISAGFTVEKIFRVYNDQFVKRFFRIHIASAVHRYLDVDFARSIVVVARK